ncbi:MAG TPA: PD-(D/E)XK nuclease family protein [Candidatus Dormibacteraeota bacterium]|nr:PD-(D/E)XK nuclease family protein [Candidatus Dormibacteraeota bacterium]
MPDHLSFSQVSALSGRFVRSCPRRWSYKKLFGMQDKPGTAMLCGTLIDQAAQTYLLRRQVNVEPEKARQAGLDQLMTQAPALEWPASTDVERYTQLVAEGYTALTFYLGETVPATVQERHEFTVRGEDGELVEMIGYSDWVTSDGVIVDLKWTGKARWNKDGLWDEEWLREKRYQLVTYWTARAADRHRLDRANDMASAAGLPVTPWSQASVTRVGRIVCVQHSLRQKQPVVKSIDLCLTLDDRAYMIGAIREADTIMRSGIHSPRPGLACQPYPGISCAFVDQCRHDLGRTTPPTQSIALGGAQ